MNTTKNAQRMEKLRKARSLNDVISVVKDVSKDILQQQKIVKKMKAIAANMEATAAGKPVDTRTIRIDGSGMGEDIKLRKLETPDVKDAKDNVRLKLAKKKFSNGIPLTKFVAPKPDALQKHTDVIHDLHENLMELDVARQKIATQFSKATNLKVALKGIDALVKEVNASLSDAYEELEKIGKKHLPTELENMNLVLQEFLQEHIDEKNYDDITAEVFVTVKDIDEEKKDDGKKNRGPKKMKIDVNNADFTFYCYTIIHGLKNDQGYEFAEYCVVLTGMVDRNHRLRYYLNALPDFKPPAKFGLGAEVTDQGEMETRATMLLAHNNLLTEFEKKPLPLTTKTAREKGFHTIQDVESVHVIDDELRVTIARGKATPSNIEKIKNEVRTLLNGVVGNTRLKRSVVMPRKTKDKNGQIVLQFTLVPNIPDISGSRKDSSLNVSKLLELQNALGLPDEVVKEIKDVIKNHV